MNWCLAVIAHPQNRTIQKSHESRYDHHANGRIIQMLRQKTRIVGEGGIDLGRMVNLCANFQKGFACPIPEFVLNVVWQFAIQRSRNNCPTEVGAAAFVAEKIAMRTEVAASMSVRKFSVNPGKRLVKIPRTMASVPGAPRPAP